MHGSPLERAVSRRALLRGSLAAAAGAGALAIAGCGADADPPPIPTAAFPTTSAPTIPASPSTPPSSPVRGWAQVATPDASPGPRRDHSLTLDTDTGSIYLIGGRVADDSFDDVWAFDPGAKSWREISAIGDKPAPRFAHNALYDPQRTRIVVAMGQGNGGALFNDVWAFDPATAAWTDISAGAGPSVRYGTGGAYDPEYSRLLVSHGFTDGGRFDDSWSYDLATAQWTKVATTGPLPIKRCLLRTTWSPADRRMLLFGGQTDSNPFLGDFWSLDVTSGVWTESTPSSLPGPRNLYGASLDESGRRWYVVGGNTPNGATGDTWFYDLSTDAWHPGDDPLSSSALPPRYSTDAAVAANTLYVYGGHDGSAEISDMWMLPLA